MHQRDACQVDWTIRHIHIERERTRMIVDQRLSHRVVCVARHFKLRVCVRGLSVQPHSMPPCTLMFASTYETAPAHTGAHNPIHTLSSDTFTLSRRSTSAIISARISASLYVIVPLIFMFSPSAKSRRRALPQDQRSLAQRALVSIASQR